MDNIVAHISRANESHNRVEIGSIVIEESTRIMDNLGNLANIFIKDTNRVGVGKHERSRIFPNGSFKRLEVYTAIRTGGNVYGDIIVHCR